MGGREGVRVRRDNLIGTRNTLCKLRTRVLGRRGARELSEPLPLALGWSQPPPREPGKYCRLSAAVIPAHFTASSLSLISRHRQAALLGLLIHGRRHPRGGTVQSKGPIRGAFGFWECKREESQQVLFDRLHHQDLALALGNLVQRKHSLVRGQVERAAHGRGHRRRDGPALHHAA